MGMKKETYLGLEQIPVEKPSKSPQLVSSQMSPRHDLSTHTVIIAIVPYAVFFEYWITSHDYSRQSVNLMEDG